MILLLHGKNSQEIDKRLDYFVQKGFRKFYGNAKELQVLASTNTNLFQQKSEGIIISLETNKNIDLEGDLKNIIKSPFSKNINLIITSTEKNLDDFVKKNKLSNKVKIEKLSEKKDTEIFGFLDALFLGDLEKTMQKAESLLKRYSGGYLITMIFSNIRNSLFLRYDKEAFNKLHPYVQQKTKSIDNKISKKGLYNVIMALKEADYKLKSSIDDKSILTSIALYIKSTLDKP